MKDEDTNADLARKLWAIGDLARLRILQRLPSKPPDADDCGNTSNVSRLAAQLGLSQPTVSHHLRILRQAGLVTHTKMCRDCFYWINPEAADEVLKSLKDTLAAESPKGATGASDLEETVTTSK